MTVPQNRNLSPSFGQAAFQSPREPPVSLMFRKEVTFAGLPPKPEEQQPSRKTERSNSIGKKMLQRSNSHGSVTLGPNSKKQVAAIPIFPASPGGYVDGERPCSLTTRSGSYDSLTSGAVSPDQKNYSFSSSPEAPEFARRLVRQGHDISHRYRLSRSLSLQSWQPASSKVSNPDSSVPPKLTKTKGPESKKSLYRSFSLGSPRRTSSAIKQERKFVTQTLSRLGSLKLSKTDSKTGRGNLKVPPAATVPRFGDWDDDSLGFSSDITKRFDNVIKEKKAGRSGGGGKVMWAAELEAYQSALDDGNNSRKLHSKGSFSTTSKPWYADVSNSNRLREQEDDGKNSTFQRKGSLKVWQDIHDNEVKMQSSTINLQSKWSFNKTKEGEDDASNLRQAPRNHQYRKSFDTWTEQQFSPSIKLGGLKLRTTGDLNSKDEDAKTKQLNSQMVRPTISKWLCCAATAVKV